MTSMQSFVQRLAKVRMPGLFNPWGESCVDEGGDIRASAGWRERQRRLLAHIDCREPRVVLIGEAAGYQGCRYSGVGFTSEWLILERRVPRVEADGRITKRRSPWREPSATIVWAKLHDMGIAENAVIFNAVPWHPMGEGGAHSNRKPTAEERQAGRPFVEEFIAFYPGVLVVAVGETASKSLTDIGIKHTKVRHPSHGGAKAFRKGLHGVLGGI